MKRICYLLVLISGLSTMSDTSAQAFIHIYNHGKKIGKGYVALIADTVIVLETKKKQLQRFPVREISFIKTDRGLGYSVLTGFGAGLLGSALIARGVSYFDVEDKALGIIIISGTAAGTVTGFVTGIVKKRKKLIINHDPEKWKALESYWIRLLANDI